MSPQVEELYRKATEELDRSDKKFSAYFFAYIHLKHKDILWRSLKYAGHLGD